MLWNQTNLGSDPTAPLNPTTLHGSPKGPFRETRCVGSSEHAVGGAGDAVFVEPAGFNINLECREMLSRSLEIFSEEMIIFLFCW